MPPTRTISLALFTPALVLNLVVIGVLGYAISGAIQDVIYTDGEGSIGPALGLIFAGLESLYLIVAILLTLAHVSVPSLAAILLDSLYLIPCYIGGAVSLGILIDYNYFGGPEEGSCYSDRISVEACQKTHHTFENLQLAVLISQFMGLVLVVVDLVRIIRIHRAGKKEQDSV
ncbi:hypothetical protein C8J57DRAFT_1533415 [Mycena rebaudengoi]|nr:hypothetical protein C8J57DRAFT_1533415 [Mycena rebaudengoi]